MAAPVSKARVKPEPRFAPIALACLECGATWDDWQPVDVAVGTWAAHIESLVCPVCRAGVRRLRLRVAGET